MSNLSVEFICRILFRIYLSSLYVEIACRVYVEFACRVYMSSLHVEFASRVYMSSLEVEFACRICRRRQRQPEEIMPYLFTNNLIHAFHLLLSFFFTQRRTARESRT